MSKEKILIIEDDKNISKLLKYNLEKAGFLCETDESGKECFEILNQQNFDLIILDIMLPDVDGFEICKFIKQNEKLSSIPIIMLTAKGEEVDKVVGFELGADDYVVKPFSPRELILRIKAVLKRVKPKEYEQKLLRFDKIKVDLSKHKVTIGEKEIALTIIEFNLLTTLMKRKGRVQSRENLLNDVWDISSELDTRTIDTHVKRLRQKLGNMGDFIETVRGIGYKFSEEE